MIKIQVPGDNNFLNPKKTIALIESILKIQAKLKDYSLTIEESNFLISQLSSLVNKASIELSKPRKPELLVEKERKYFMEPLISYFEELVMEMKEPFNLYYLGSQKSRKVKKKRAPKTSELPPGIDKDTVIWYRLLSRDSFKDFKRMQYLDQLEIKDKQEDHERSLRCEIYLFSPYLISRYISLRLELINISEGWKQRLLQQEVMKKEKQIEHFERRKFILDKIIEISLALNNETLSEAEIAHYNQEREKWRSSYKMELVELAKSGIDMEEDFDNFTIKKEQLGDVIAIYEKHLIQMRDLEKLKREN
ncbi:MAG: hypothetical protein ACFE9M_06745 [Promethearchaeota archaeon]